MARALIVGCGCRGRALAAQLAGEGMVVRGTSRSQRGVAEIEAARIEAAIADPDRPGTILDLVADVAVVVHLLAPARGEPADIASIHGPRLEALLARLVDTPVRGFAYEPPPAAGESPQGGAEIVAAAAATWSIPVALLGASAAGGWEAWAAATAAEVTALLR